MILSGSKWKCLQIKISRFLKKYVNCIGIEKLLSSGRIDVV